MNKEPLLEVEGLTLGFRTRTGEVQAVRGVSFDVGKGEAVAIVGESGCGKSVTAQSILKLLPSPPAVYLGGSIRYRGGELLDQTEREIRALRGREIGMVFQDPMTSLNPTLTIGHQLAEPLRKHLTMSREQARAKAVELLGEVGIAEPDRRARQYPHELSGGMRQRVLIAMALACEPALLIADEPTTALDVTIQAQILRVLKERQRERGFSILLITHDLGVVAELCDRILVMYAGQVVESGPTRELLTNPQHPYTRGLLRSAPSLENDRQALLQPIEGTPPGLLHPPPGCAFADRCEDAMAVCVMRELESHHVKPGHEARCWLHHPLAGQFIRF